MTLRVLFLGETWRGSCGLACASALRRLGCDVHALDFNTVFPAARERWFRALIRAAAPAFVRDYNLQIVELARHLRPDVLFAFKGMHVSVATLQTLRSHGIALYNYYPDRLYFAIGTPLADSLPEYDCLFDTKSHWEPITRERIRVRARAFVPHGYDADVHCPVELDPRDREDYGCDVSVVATHTPLKEEWLASLLALRPKLDVGIWGGNWDRRCRSTAVQRCVRGRPIEGSRYARAIQAARINLALLGVTGEIKDTTTTRTFEIPACRAFMLHEHTDELLSLFDEGREVATYRSPDDLAEKIDYYLAHSEERKTMSAAAHARCVPRYSYDERMKTILAWHNQLASSLNPGQRCLTG